VGRRDRLRVEVSHLEALARDYGRAASKAKNDDKGDLPRKLQSWVKQSRALAASDAYTPEIRSAIAGAGDSRQVTVAISNAYLADMRATAARQIGLAGRRTASVLDTLAVVGASAGCARQVN
jgi:hypothetical protein